MNKKYNLLMLLALAFLFTLSACGGQATMEGGTTDPGQIVEGDTGDNGDVTLDQLSDTNKTPIADAEEVSTQEPYIVSLDDIPADLLGAFEYGYSTVHSEKPDLDEAERLERYPTTSMRFIQSGTPSMRPPSTPSTQAETPNPAVTPAPTVEHSPAPSTISLLPATTMVILAAAVVLQVALPNPMVGTALVILSPILVLVLPAAAATLMMTSLLPQRRS